MGDDARPEAPLRLRVAYHSSCTQAPWQERFSRRRQTIQVKSVKYSDIIGIAV